jgi:hypothetical protein
MNSLDEIRRSGYSYVPALDSGDSERAKLIARTTVTELKMLMEHPPTDNSEEFLDSVFHLSVFFRLLYDFAVLKELTSPDDWFRHEKSLETVWDRLCDCKDRLEFTRYRIKGLMIERIANILEELEAFYSKHFGQGKYFSPEIVVKREICSICKQDIQCCSHISGRIYAGRLCAAIADGIGIQLRCGAIVEVPHDPRCRIWPWQIEEGKESWIKMMSFFRIDDFMETDEWK